MPSARVWRRIAAVMLGAAGVLHLVLVPEYVAEKPWLGILFILAVPLTLGPAAWLWRRRSMTAWLVGAGVASAMILAYILSRTVGLMGYTSSDWAEGIPALIVEAIFLVIAGSHTLDSAATAVATKAKPPDQQ